MLVSSQKMVLNKIKTSCVCLHVHLVNTSHYIKRITNRNDISQFKQNFLAYISPVYIEWHKN